MEPIRISVDQGADWAARRWLTYKEPQITEVRKNQILPVTKYNLLVTAFNISTILLVAAVAFAILFAYAAAVAVGAIAIFTRLTTEKELKKFTLPHDPHPPAAAQAQGPHAQPVPPQQPPAAAPAQGVGARLWGIARDAIRDPVAYVRHAMNLATTQEKETNLFQQLGVQKPAEWVACQVEFFEHAVWRNKVPVPEAPVAAQEAAALPVAH